MLEHGGGKWLATGLGLVGGFKWLEGGRVSCNWGIDICPHCYCDGGLLEGCTDPTEEYEAECENCGLPITVWVEYVRTYRIEIREEKDA